MSRLLGFVLYLYAMSCFADSVPTTEYFVTSGIVSSQTASGSPARYSDDMFVIQPYHANYLLFSAYHFNEINDSPFRGSLLQASDHFNQTELNYQISLKIAVGDNFLGQGEHWFVGYTQRAFWQAYNKRISSPFREINHEPEVWVRFNNDAMLWGWKNRMIDLGWAHQSNGLTDDLSRSWNRAYLRMSFEKEQSVWTVSLKPWLIQPHKVNENQDVEYFMGITEFKFLSQLGRHTFQLMARDNFNFQDNKGAFELGYSYPVVGNLKAYVQWFYGYGESMIDYNYKNSTLSIGLTLGSWL